MNHDRPTGTPAPGSGPAHDDLAEQVTAALRSREPGAADTAAMTRQIAARVEAAHVEAARGQVRSTTPFARRAGTVAVTGVIASALGVVGAATAAAANPYTDFAAAVDGVAHAVGVDWTSMPDGFTREQYDAFWDAEYTSEDLHALEDLWNVDTLEAKARAGQMLLDGETVPVAPGTTGSRQKEHFVSEADMEVFREAGYSVEDAEVLAKLWQTDTYEAKTRVAEMVRVGKTPPLP